MTMPIAPTTNAESEAAAIWGQGGVVGEGHHLQRMRETTMQQRINYSKVAPEGIRALGSLETYLRDSGLDPGLLNLIKTRASQLNGCAYCLDMHTKDARAGGETEQRLYALSAWRATPFYTDRERAALAWTEALTLISHGPVSDALYEEARRHFSEKAMVDLTLALVAINGWNRLSVAFHTVPGTYQPKAPSPAAREPRKGVLARSD
jgi:AhpD family alkylhydroperoxidase